MICPACSMYGVVIAYGSAWPACRACGWTPRSVGELDAIQQKAGADEPSPVVEVIVEAPEVKIEKSEGIEDQPLDTPEV